MFVSHLELHTVPLTPPPFPSRTSRDRARSNRKNRIAQNLEVGMVVGVFIHYRIGTGLQVVGTLMLRLSKETRHIPTAAAAETEVRLVQFAS